MGCTIILVDDLTTTDPPIANFSASPLSGSAPLVVTFNDQSTNTPTSWYWTFGDGATSTFQNPTHQYQTEGHYTVSLKVTNSKGSNTKTITNFISATGSGSEPGCLLITIGEVPGDAPVANFVGLPTSGTAPLVVAFTDQSVSNPTSWYWTFGDAATSSSRNPTHTYQNSGRYTVSMKASNSYGSDTETKSGYIVVGEIPQVCVDGAIRCNPTNPCVREQCQNNAWVVLDPEGCCPSEDPIPNYKKVCEKNAKPTKCTTGTVMTLYDDTLYDQPLYFYTDFGDGTVIEGVNPQHIYAEPGVYPVTYTVCYANGDCYATTDTIIVPQEETGLTSSAMALGIGSLALFGGLIWYAGRHDYKKSRRRTKW
jgi:PKD repeat protein